MKTLNQGFYLQDAIHAAKALLGKFLVRSEGDKNYYFKIVETEAYMGEEDKGAHAFGGKRTNRTAPMFEIGGITYIYLIYGMYHCLNIVVNKEEVPQCVLIRAVEPLDEAAISFAKVHRNIKSSKVADLTNGPGKLCKALAIDKSLNAKSVKEQGALWLAEGEEENFKIISAKRINIPYAEEYQDVLWRFYIKDNPFVSVK